MTTDAPRIMSNAHHEVKVPALVRVKVPPVCDPMLTPRYFPSVPAGAVVVIDAQEGDSAYRILSCMGMAIETPCAAIATLIGCLRTTAIVAWSRSPRIIPGQTFSIPIDRS